MHCVETIAGVSIVRFDHGHGAPKKLRHKRMTVEIERMRRRNYNKGVKRKCFSVNAVQNSARKSKSMVRARSRHRRPRQKHDIPYIDANAAKYDMTHGESVK